MILWLFLSSSGFAQDYRFPTTSAHYSFWYPTAYKDQGGRDWNCGSIYYSGHRGSDFGGGSFAGMDAGRDVVAAAPGIVDYVNDGEFDRCTSGTCDGGGGFGNFVKLRHADGKSTFYAHLKQYSVAVAVGDVVSCGQLLGQMGSSGNSTGPHLHFEVRNSAGDSHDPFDGNCSNPPTYWVQQGVYDALPGLTCDGPLPTCAPAAELTCGDVVQARNDGVDSQLATSMYGCTEFSYTGPEIAYTVRTDRDEPVTIGVQGLTADLDVYVTNSPACDGSGCVVASNNPDNGDELATFSASAGVAYNVVIDGWQGAVSGFTLTIDCQGGWSPADTDEPLDTDDPFDTDDSLDTDNRLDTDTPDETGVPTDISDDEIVMRRMGCACSGVGELRFGWGALLALAWLARRRRSGRVAMLA